MDKKDLIQRVLIAWLPGLNWNKRKVLRRAEQLWLFIRNS